MPYIQRNSPLKDAKFMTSLQPAATNPEELIQMNPQERSEARESLSDAVATCLTFNPAIGGLTKFAKGMGYGGKALIAGGLGGLIKKNLGRIGSFAAQKLGLKGGTEVAQQVGKM